MRYCMFVLLAYFGACTNPVKESREAKIVEELTGKEMVFTNFLLADHPFVGQSSGNIFQQKISKIVTIINFDCGSCRESIKKWKEYLNGKNITFIIIVKGSNEDFFNEIRSKESSSFLYIYYDRDNVFESTNKIPQDTRFQTFLINSENKIRIIGNPLFNKAIAKLYDEETISVNAPAIQ